MRVLEFHYHAPGPLCYMKSIVDKKVMMLWITIFNLALTWILSTRYYSKHLTNAVSASSYNGLTTQTLSFPPNYRRGSWGYRNKISSDAQPQQKLVYEWRQPPFRFSVWQAGSIFSLSHLQVEKVFYFFFYFIKCTKQKINSGNW